MIHSWGRRTPAPWAQHSATEGFFGALAREHALAPAAAAASVTTSRSCKAAATSAPPPRPTTTHKLSKSLYVQHEQLDITTIP